MVKTWQVVLATIGIFVAGLVTGGATAIGIANWAGWRGHAGQPREGAQAPRLAGPQNFNPQLMRAFANQLDLTPEQRARIQPIVRRTASELGRERREVQLASALMIERMQDEIAAVLRPDQRAKFEDLIRKQHERLQEFKRLQAAAQQAQADGAAGAQPAPAK